MSATSATRSWFDRCMRSIFRAGDLVPHKGALDPKPLVKDYIKTAKRYPYALLLIFSSTVIERIAYVFVPIALKGFIDALTGATPNKGLAMESLSFYTVLFFISWLGSRLTTFGLCYKTPLVIADLKKSGMHYLIRHNHRFFASVFLGALVKRLDRYASHYDNFADKIVFDIIPTIIQFTAVIVVLWLAEPMLSLIVIIWLIVVICANTLFSKWKLPYDAGRAMQDSKTTGVLADIMANIPTVATHASYDKEEGRFAHEVDEQARWTRFSWMSGALYDAFQGLSVRVIEIAILFFGAYLLLEGKTTLGTLVMAHTYVRIMSDQTWQFSRIFRELYTCFADGKEMTDILAIPHEISEPHEPKVPAQTGGLIEFKNVSFGYQGEQILAGLNLAIRPGERVALVGPSGSGKSTVARLILRDYDPKEGSVLVDGCDLRTMSLVERARHMALVPQDPALFHLSLRENIRYGRPCATDQEVEEAARRAEADAFIRSTPHGYDTLVGERGVKLSGGQRQRVAIARAILRNAPILILDEATSSLDSESELYIQRALAELMKGKTTLVIAHRLSTIRTADRIVVLENGDIAEEGTHEDLLLKGGLYARHWSLQKDGFVTDMPDSVTGG